MTKFLLGTILFFSCFMMVFFDARAADFEYVQCIYEYDTVTFGFRVEKKGSATLENLAIYTKDSDYPGQPGELIMASSDNIVSEDRGFNITTLWERLWFFKSEKAKDYTTLPEYHSMVLGHLVDEDENGHVVGNTLGIITNQLQNQQEGCPDLAIAVYDGHFSGAENEFLSGFLNKYGENRDPKKFYIVSTADTYIKDDWELFGAKYIQSIQGTRCSVMHHSPSDLMHAPLPNTVRECEKAPAVESPSVETQSHTCSYTFGGDVSQLSLEEKKTYCNFLVDSKFVFTKTIYNDLHYQVGGAAIETKQIDTTITDRFTNLKKMYGIPVPPLDNDLLSYSIREDSSEYGKMSVKMFPNTMTAIHINETPGSCIPGSAVYAYYYGDGYQITLDEEEAKKGNTVGYYCTGDGNVIKGSSRGDLYGCDVIPEDIREWILDTLNLVKYVALVLVIVLGALDFIKAAASGEADQMKKSGSSFLKRLIAVVILFLVPLIVEVILNLIEIYGADSTCIGLTK